MSDYFLLLRILILVDERIKTRKVQAANERGSDVRVTDSCSIFAESGSYQREFQIHVVNMQRLRLLNGNLTRCTQRIFITKPSLSSTTRGTRVIFCCMLMTRNNSATSSHHLYNLLAFLMPSAGHRNLLLGLFYTSGRLVC